MVSKNFLTNVDKKIIKLIKNISKEADKNNISLFIVGGVVRDLILKRPNFDLDFVVKGDAISFARNLSLKLKCKLKTYKQFKTATLILCNGIRIDFATTRKESYSQSGALPTVKPGILINDLFRRDFTINAMAISVNKNNFGQLIDEFGGYKDLTNKKIKILHDKSFNDDSTRILRAVRFEQRFNFKIEHKTLNLLKSAIKNNLLDSIKPQRCFVEFKKNLSESDPVKNLRRLNNLGGLNFIFRNFKVNFVTLNKVFKSFKILKNKCKDKLNYKKWLVFFIAMFDGSSPGTLEKILIKFNFSSEEKKAIIQSQKIRYILKKFKKINMKPSEVYKILKPLKNEVVILLMAMSSQKEVINKIERFVIRDIKSKLNINGNDLKKIGINSGKKIGEILRKTLYYKIDNNINSTKKELMFASKIADG